MKLNEIDAEAAIAARTLAIAELKAALANLEQPATYSVDIVNAQRRTAQAMDRLDEIQNILGSAYFSNKSLICNRDT